MEIEKRRGAKHSHGRRDPPFPAARLQRDLACAPSPLDRAWNVRPDWVEFHAVKAMVDLAMDGVAHHAKLATAILQNGNYKTGIQPIPLRVSAKAASGYAGGAEPARPQVSGKVFRHRKDRCAFSRQAVAGSVMGHAGDSWNPGYQQPVRASPQHTI